MIGKPGPFQIIRSDESGGPNTPGPAPRRRYSCANYETCLDLAAAVNWDNFTCRGCSGEIDQALYWRAHQAMKKDGIVKTLCEIPQIKSLDFEPPPLSRVKAAGKS
jgi:hypothetical protein